MVFQAADTNADGRVTRAEMSGNMIKIAFAKVDKNGDKVITREEWEAVDREPGSRQRFESMDKNRNATITFFEFSESARRTMNVDKSFAALDRDENGTLSSDEYSGHPHFKILSVQF